MVFKFAVGDAVRVVPPLRMAELVKSSSPNGVILDMVKYGGLTAVITEAYESDYDWLPRERYHIKFDTMSSINEYFWCADALEPLEEPFKPLSDAEINDLYA